MLHPKQLEKENISNNSIKIEYSLSKDYKKLTSSKYISKNKRYELEEGISTVITQRAGSY